MVRVELGQRHQRRPGAVGDQDVRGAAARQQFGRGRALRQVGHQWLDGCTGLLCDAAGSPVQPVEVAPDDVHIGSFARQRQRTGESESATGRADERTAALDAEVHGVTPP